MTRNTKYDHPHIPHIGGPERLHQQGPDSHRDHLQEDGDGGDAGRLQRNELRHGQPQQQQQEPRVHAEVLRGQDRHGGPLQAHQGHLQAGRERGQIVTVMNFFIVI